MREQLVCAIWVCSAGVFAGGVVSTVAQSLMFLHVRSGVELSGVCALQESHKSSRTGCLSRMLGMVDCNDLGRVRHRRVVEADARLAVCAPLVAEGVLDGGNIARRGAGEVIRAHRSGRSAVEVDLERPLAKRKDGGSGR